MTLKEFLSDRLGRLVLQPVSMAVMAVFLLATGTQAGILIIILIVWFLLFLILQAYDFLKLRSHLDELKSIMDGLDQKHLFSECVPTPHNAYERRIYQLMRRSGKAMIEAVSDARCAQRDYREYIESWVHEIKTPITAARLICRSAEPRLRAKLSRELSQIDNHVNGSFYARRKALKMTLSFHGPSSPGSRKRRSNSTSPFLYKAVCGSRSGIWHKPCIRTASGYALS